MPNRAFNVHNLAFNVPNLVFNMPNLAFNVPNLAFNGMTMTNIFLKYTFITPRNLSCAQDVKRVSNVAICVKRHVIKIIIRLYLLSFLLL